MLFMSRLCAVLAAICGITGVVMWIRQDPPEPEGYALTVEEPVRDLGELPIGKHPITFRISNASSRPLRVIGGLLV